MTPYSFCPTKFSKIETPCYFYDINLLRETLQTAQKEASEHNYQLHYAVKANHNPRILQEIAGAGIGADCVTANEITMAIHAGIPPSKIVFAGVGKTDKEIALALDYNIFCFNVESLPEIEVINSIAKQKRVCAHLALRINPNIDAHTHKYITTGLNENKFGILLNHLPKAIELLQQLQHVKLIGLHFHIGSQITDLEPFKNLCISINHIQKQLQDTHIEVQHINIGGGLGIDYQQPDQNPIPAFKEYFNTFAQHLLLQPQQQLHSELGRALVAQCGSLIARTLYVKEGETKNFVIVDAGMTDLIRPALYQAYHHIENISSELPKEAYDIVGPICESADLFASNYPLNETKRGDIIVFRSAGAYGEVMASQYNGRELPKSLFSDSL